MVWGAIGAIGGALIGANSASKDRKNTREMNEMNNRGYTDARPYITAGYSGGQNALNDALAKGYYGGPTRAGFNNQMTTGLDNRFNLGTSGFNNANNFMNIGSSFAGNAANLYNMASADNLGDAQRYATANSQPLIDAAMRGADRNLNETQLPGLNRMAAGSGNTNNSRAGLTEAVLRRANSETYADTAANVNRGLMNDYMNQANNQFRNMSSANNTLGNLFTTGFNLGNNATGMQTDVGAAYQGDEQGRLDDNRMRFEGERDFALDQYNQFMSGILGRAQNQATPRSPNYSNPTMGAFSGAQAGFGFGGKYLQPIFDKFSSPAQRPGATYWPSGPGYDPSF
jgi:hypothetical protein